MKRRIDRYLNDIFKTPFNLELSPILLLSLLNVVMSVGTIVKIEIDRRILQAVFSADGYALLYGILFLTAYELVYSGIVQLNNYKYAETEGNLYGQLLDKVLNKNERLRSLGNCPMGANDRFSMASEDCGNSRLVQKEGAVHGNTLSLSRYAKKEIENSRGSAVIIKAGLQFLYAGHCKCIQG